MSPFSTRASGALWAASLVTCTLAQEAASGEEASSEPLDVYTTVAIGLFIATGALLALRAAMSVATCNLIVEEKAGGCKECGSDCETQSA